MRVLTEPSFRNLTCSEGKGRTEGQSVTARRGVPVQPGKEEVDGKIYFIHPSIHYLCRFILFSCLWGDWNQFIMLYN